ECLEKNLERLGGNIKVQRQLEQRLAIDPGDRRAHLRAEIGDHIANCAHVSASLGLRPPRSRVGLFVPTARTYASRVGLPRSRGDAPSGPWLRPPRSRVGLFVPTARTYASRVGLPRSRGDVPFGPWASPAALTCTPIPSIRARRAWFPRRACVRVRIRRR